MIREDIDLDAANSPERRREPRPQAPPPSLAPRARRIVDAVAEYIDTHWIGWVIYGLICLAAIAFIVWSLVFRTETLHEDHARMVELAAMERTFTSLTEQYSTEELRELLKKVSTAEASVFADYAELAQWLGNQASRAQSLDLVLTYTMLDTVPAQIKNVSEVPVELELVPKEELEAGAYSRMLIYLRNLVDSIRHLEITDAQLKGNGQTVEQMTTTVHVWVDQSS